MYEKKKLIKQIKDTYEKRMLDHQGEVNLRRGRKEKKRKIVKTVSDFSPTVLDQSS